MKIFIGGSRSGTDFGRLPQYVYVKLDSIMKNRHSVLVGDAKGVDKAVQKYLYSKGYEDVTVFVSGENEPRYYACRDEKKEIQSAKKKWSVESIVEEDNLKNRKMRELKDKKMADLADYGFMIWQPLYKNRFGRESVSSGTLANIFNLLVCEKPKPVRIFYKPDDDFLDFDHINDLECFLERVDVRIKKRYEEIKNEYEKKERLRRKKDQEKQQLAMLYKEK